ncbi:MAG: hypothetical protein HS100_18850 [Anaerolineales bacterium]|nr:hypothetical protein [Anaerolineales bacterium]
MDFYYMKIGFSIIFLISAFLCLIYSLFLLFQFWAKRLTKGEAIKKTFIVIFCSVMAILLATYIWQADWNITHWVFFFFVSIPLASLVAFAFIASFLTGRN